jgi:hypothetical protein
VFVASSRVPPAAVGAGEDGCLRLRAGAVVPLQVAASGTFEVDRVVGVTWTDARGTDRRTVPAGVIGLAEPLGKTKVTVRALPGDPTTLCGLKSPEPPAS